MYQIKEHMIQQFLVLLFPVVIDSQELELIDHFNP
jgi:hypothetical protein